MTQLERAQTLAYMETHLASQFIFKWAKSGVIGLSEFYTLNKMVHSCNTRETFIAYHYDERTEKLK